MTNAISYLCQSDFADLLVCLSVQDLVSFSVFQPANSFDKIADSFHDYQHNTHRGTVLTEFDFRETQIVV